jgi:hypothetical protein
MIVQSQLDAVVDAIAPEIWSRILDHHDANEEGMRLWATNKYIRPKLEAVARAALEARKQYRPGPLDTVQEAEIKARVFHVMTNAAASLPDSDDYTAVTAACCLNLIEDALRRVSSDYRAQLSRMLTTAALRISP